MMCGSYALQSGGDSMALGTGRGMKQALGAAKNRIDKSHPLVRCWSPGCALRYLLQR